MDRGAWWAAVHGIAKSQTGVSDLTLSHFHHRISLIFVCVCVCLCVCVCVCVCVYSVISNSSQHFWTAVRQASLPTEFFRQEY